MSVRYPVAATADAALSAPLGRAGREREAATLAGEVVAFVTEAAGPAFATREAALDAYAGRLDDERPGHVARVGPEDRWCDLAEVAAERRHRPPAPLRPDYRDGRRWGAAPEKPPTCWRLMVSYWKAGAPEPISLEQARRARKSAEGEALDARQIRALTLQPLQPVRPQQPLDVGLFEVRVPEAPGRVMPDE